jgi:C_GCAxxG_C_C family probable redox protein
MRGRHGDFIGVIRGGGIVMSGKVEAAVGCFREGFNCSQAILSTYGDEFGLERETALKAAAAFGGGMGGLGEVCGAVTGALVVIGLKYGYTEAKDKETKERTYARARDLAGRFRSQNGALCCRELLGCDLTTAEGMATARQKGLFTELCPRFVRVAAEILEDVL